MSNNILSGHLNLDEAEMSDNSSVEGGCVRDYLTGEHIKKLGMNGVLHFT